MVRVGDFSRTVFHKKNTVAGSEIRRSPVQVGSLSPFLFTGFRHPRWLFGISSIKSIQRPNVNSFENFFKIRRVKRWMCVTSTFWKSE